MHKEWRNKLSTILVSSDVVVFLGANGDEVAFGVIWEGLVLVKWTVSSVSKEPERERESALQKEAFV